MRVALSWSGGKDGALALARLREEGHDVVLVHLTDAATRRDRAHGVPDFLVQEQAACMGARLHLGASDVAGYERALLDALQAVAPDAVAFGDIHLEEHRAWGERVARAAGVEPAFPLWEMLVEDVVEEAVLRGIRAFVVAARAPLDASFLGRFLEADLIADVAARGGDVAGEDGCYHTFVVGGPSFRRRVDATAGGVREAPEIDGWQLDLSLRGC